MKIKSLLGFGLLIIYHLLLTNYCYSTNWGASFGITFKPVVVDTTSPAAVTDLSAIPGANTGEIKLTWSMPGDDGWVGVLPGGSQFRIQYSTWTEIIWSTASAQIIQSTTAVNPGTLVSWVVSGLVPASTYYFCLWISDEASPPNWSGISNTATAYAYGVLKYNLDGYVYAFRDRLQQGLSNVNIDLSAGGRVYETKTNAEGYYKFLNIPSGSYTLIPTKSGWEFEPQNRQIELNRDIRVESFYGKIETPEVGEIRSVVIENPEDISKGTLNPDKGESAVINFTGSSPGVYNLRIFSRLGELIYEESKTTTTNSDYFTWSPKDLSSGIYIVHIEGPGVRIYKKIAIVR